MNQFLPEGRRFSTQTNQELLNTLDGLREAMEQQLILEAIPYRCDAAHRLHFTLAGLSVQMPREECAVGVSDGTTKEISILSRVGKPTCFLVDGLVAEDGVITPKISRRKAQELCLKWLLSLPTGTVIPATVSHLERFGAFVDVGCGVPSLIPLDAISISRIPHPSCRFQVGDEIFVAIKGTLPDQNRLLLSHKELLGTWEENAASFAPGEVVTGTVRGVLDYGIFVELAPNLPALAEYIPGIEDGDRVSVFIKSIIPEKEKIKLLILDRIGKQEEKIPPVYHITDGIIRNWSFHRVQ